jgi:hypothetical protein
MKSSYLIIIAIVVCCCVSLVIALSLYFTNTACSLGTWAGSDCSSGSPESSSPGTTPASSTSPSGTPASGTSASDAGSPASDPSRPESSNYSLLGSSYSSQGCLTTPAEYNAAKIACGGMLGGDTMGLNPKGCWRCLKMEPTGPYPGTRYSIRYAI